MADDDSPHVATEIRSQDLSKDAPPSPPSSPDAVADPETKLSRKREREISLEPGTPKAPVVDDPIADKAASKDSRSPAKKNRVFLDATVEEGEGLGAAQARTPPRSYSPPISGTPLHEIKVRQISQGVEDINWKNKGRVSNGTETMGDSSAAPDTIDIAAHSASRSSSPKPTNGAHEQHPSRRSSESDNEKGLKRKLEDRAASQGPEASSSAVSADTNKRQRDDAGQDENPRETKRPTPPPESSDAKTASTSTETQKRPRDDADEDKNPRETKRPSPPPDKPAAKPTSTPAPKLGGFAAYASTASPFASVTGKNIFGSAKATPSPSPFSTSLPPGSPFSSSSFPPTPFATPGSSALGSKSSDSPLSTPSTSTKRSGFEAFASSASPFATAAARAKSPTGFGQSSAFQRSKSPARRANPANAQAFSSYATGGAHGFTMSVSKRARGGSPDGALSGRSSLERPNSASNVLDGDKDDAEDDDAGQVTFGDKLRAGKDSDEEGKSDEDEPKVALTEQDIQTGEEDEDTVHQVRGKLYALTDNAWKERGTGQLKLNVRQSDGSRARLVMRKEAVYTLILNVTLFKGMKVYIDQDPRYIRFSVIEGGMAQHYNLRVSNGKVAEELLEDIMSNIPA
ncbi:hypothetical protein PLICRDRAFT_44450 [Plicaturopsis crispa FD-325 SS-3]|nr:hypothetical protein PLICRDRAFT_44450 [Plicaturopsis crispa FD-325 SS-3]